MVAVVAINNMRSTLETPPISDAAEADVAELRRLLEGGGAKGHRGPREVALPNKLHRLLLRILEDLADGKAVSLSSAAQVMTTQQAANFLGVSRQFLVRLLDEGKIPFHRAGTHRRVYLQDLISFRKRRDRRRHEAIEQMARDAVKQGVYDEF
jgi:excisionase family DNA binding protein